MLRGLFPTSAGNGRLLAYGRLSIRVVVRLLIRGKPQPEFMAVRPALPTLAQLIYSPVSTIWCVSISAAGNAQDEEVLTDACWALSYLSDGPNEKIQVLLRIFFQK